MKPLITTKPDMFNPDVIARAEREGIKIDKGATLTQEYLERNEELIKKYIQFFSAYPDLFLDLIAPHESGFRLYFYQRIVLRAMMRYKDVFVVACRAFSKSFLSILALMLQCVFMPGTKRFICAPFKNQSAQIAKEKILEIYDRWPLLMREVNAHAGKDKPGNFGKDYITLTFKNGSVLDIVGASDSTRGGRRSGGLIDEVRDHEEGPLNEVVLPLLNVSRRLPDGTVNPKEVNQQKLYMTSAGSKTSFA